MLEKLKRYSTITLITLTSIWVCLFIWVHQPLNSVFTYGLIIVWLIFAVATGYFYLQQHRLMHYSKYAYPIAFIALLIGFFSLTPRNDRIWQDETEKIIQFKFIDGKIEIQNIRNFVWRSDTDYDVKWETRRYDIEQLESIDLIVSHFMKGPVAHVFISFGFKDGEHLAFSLEVRQEHDEGFSTIGGFFRQYELAMVVGDENDLIFSRTNAKDEDVYIYPIQMKQTEIQLLFLEYLNKANRLNHTPTWYNTYVSNCTTILFDLMEHAVGEIPRDYRVTLPGLIPNYLHDKEVLDNRLTLQQWKEKAHINQKIEDMPNSHTLSNTEFSKRIRQ